MRKIIDFNEYLLTKIFEAMDLKIKEVELVLSPRMIKILKQINHQIADDLLEKHITGDEPEFKVTFVDLGNEPGNVSFIQASKVPELVEPELVHGNYHREIGKVQVPYSGRGRKPKVPKEEDAWIGGYFDYIQSYKNPWISDIGHLVSLHDPQFKSKDHPVWHKFRAETSIGRFINTVFPKKYPSGMKKEDAAKLEKPIDIESFVNIFIATVEANSKIIKVVEGSDLVHYYNCENYQISSGTLGGSCMNSPEKGKYLKLYEDNPDKVKMLVLYPEDIRDKIIGRALIWFLDEPKDRIYMDRIYTAKDSDVYMFIEYAKSKGYLYKSSQSYGWDYDIIDGRTGNRQFVPMSVELKPESYRYYPYLDTMQYYNPKTGNITNNGKEIERGDGYYILTDAGGGYSNFN